MTDPFNSTDTTQTSPGDASATKPRRFQCRHIHTDGRCCGSAALRGEEFCYFHHTSRRPVVHPRARRSRQTTFDLPLPEDRGAIQLSIGEVLRRIAANQIDPRRAGLLLYGLQIASINLPPLRARLAADPEPPVVEEVIFDPIYGPLAPRTELPDPDAPRPNSLRALLFAAFHKTRAEIEQECRAKVLAELEASPSSQAETAARPAAQEPEVELKLKAEPSPEHLPEAELEPRREPQIAAEPEPATQSDLGPTPLSLDRLDAASEELPRLFTPLRERCGNRTSRRTRVRASTALLAPPECVISAGADSAPSSQSRELQLDRIRDLIPGPAPGAPPFVVRRRPIASPSRQLPRPLRRPLDRLN